jgi:hypothetical protein
VRNYIHQQSVGVVNEDKISAKALLVMLFFPGESVEFLTSSAIAPLGWSSGELWVVVFYNRTKTPAGFFC